MKLPIVIVAVLVLGLATYFVLNSKISKSVSDNSIMTPVPTNAQESPVIQPSESEIIESGYFYPISKYESRVTNRDHGKSTTLADSASFPCGGQFEGIHIGDDLEVTKAEVTQEVPVFAIADGKVRRASIVGGYGGLLITEHTINGQILTAYYGHIDLNQVKFKADQRFVAGELLTYLGDNCSSETNNERKHLHFDIHKGSNIDVRGYIQSLNDIAAWIDPTTFLKDLKAAEPGQ